MRAAPALAMLLALAFSLPAQCFGNYPAGTADAGLPGACTEIPGHEETIFVTPAGPVISTVGTFRLYWSQMPTLTQAPIAFTAVDTGWQVFPTLVGGSCLGFVHPNVLNVPINIVPGQPGCQTGAVVAFPPLPELAGLVFFGQGYMFEVTSGTWATSNVFVTTIQ